MPLSGTELLWEVYASLDLTAQLSLSELLEQLNLRVNELEPIIIYCVYRSALYSTSNSITGYIVKKHKFILGI